MKPAKLPRLTLYRGDKWRDAWHFGPFTENGGAITLDPCLYCRLQFRSETGELGYELNSHPTTGQGTITIVSGSNYEFDIPDQPLPLGAGTWYWDFETHTTSIKSNYPDTWFKGEVVVEADQTHD